MRFLLSFAFCAVGYAQTGYIPTAQLCVAPQIGSYVITGKVGTLSLLKFICIDPTPAPSIVSVGLVLIDALTEQTSLIPSPDGINVNFNFINTPLPGTVRIYKNGVSLVSPGDFKVVGKLLIFVAPPLSTDNFVLFFVLPRQANIPFAQ